MESHAAEHVQTKPEHVSRKDKHMENKILDIVKACMYLNQSRKDFAVECWVCSSYVRVIIEAPNFMVNHTVDLGKSRHGITTEEMLNNLDLLLKCILAGERGPMELIPYCSIRKEA